MYFPDDPSLAGEQWISLTGFQNGIHYTKTIGLTLIYEGSYTSGLGWSVADIVN